MDVNNTPYFLLRGAADFGEASSKLQWHSGRQALTLSQNQSLRLPTSTSATALPIWQNSTPLAFDGFNQIGRLSADRTRIEFNSGRGYLPLRDGELAPVQAPFGSYRDLQLGGDARLAAPYSDNANQHGLTVFHLARRWQVHCDLSVDNSGTPLPPPLRACVDCDDQIWVLTGTQLVLCRGEPLPLPYAAQPARFEPETVNPQALSLHWVQILPEPWQALAICCDDTQLYCLAHDGAGGQAVLTRTRSVRRTHEFRIYPCAGDVPFVIDLALALDSSYPVPGRLAALAPAQADDADFVQRDATILELHWNDSDASGSAELVHERYPMLSLAMPRFVSSADGQLRYQASADHDFPDISPRPRELHALRRPQYHLEGKALLQRVLDAGQPETHWHRLYLDASIPPGCAIEIGARVFNAPEQRGSAEVVPQPPPLWNSLPSEIPYAESLATQRIQHGDNARPGEHAGQSGLFEILLQRPQGAVRRMVGRYLQLQVTLRGNGRQTPCLHAVRIYYPRFAYQEAYLPELYRQERAVDPNAVGPANSADVRERLLAAFEGVLTPVEARIAASDQLVHPDATPPEHLPWLAEVLGTQLPPHWPVPRQRRLVRDCTRIQQYKGTLFGVNLALDIVSDGGIQRGEIVLVENFRLRRTMATILGINMDDADHPLTLGTGMSGNSIIGDSLILSEQDAREFLALFSPELATADEAKIVRQFFERFADQVTVLLHGRAVALRASIEAVLVEQMPAHLLWRIFETEHPFVLGTAPLLTVDTFIEPQPAFRRVRLNDSYLGREGVLKNPAAFSPADINARSAS